MEVNDAAARSALLAYAKEQFPAADAVRLLENDFDHEIVGVVQFKFSGARVKAGVSQELWERVNDFAELRSHMERHEWQKTVNQATSQAVVLGQGGWLKWD